MLRLKFWALSLCFTLASTLLAPSGIRAQPSRPYAVDDLLALEQLSKVTISPDGRWVAYVLRRPARPGEKYQQMLGGLGESRTDIWLVRSDGRERRRLTPGNIGEAYWNPVWSPDSSALAMLSQAGGDGVQVYVWRQATNRIERLLDRNVDLVVSTTPGGGNRDFQPLLWLDDHRLLVPLVAPGHYPLPYEWSLTGPRIQVEGWRDATEGRRPTASVLVSSPDAVRAAQSPGELVIVDVKSRTTRSLGIVPLDETTKGMRFLSLSPDKSAVAVVSRSVATPDPDELLDNGANHRLGIFSLNERIEPLWLDDIDLRFDNQFRYVLRWSPDSSDLVLLTKSNNGAADRLVRVSRANGAVENVLPSGWSGSTTARSGELGLLQADAHWTESDHLIVLAAAPQASRRDWWLLGERQPVNLTASLSNVPERLFPQSGSSRYIGLADRSLVEVDIGARRARTLPQLAGEVRGIEPAGLMGGSPGDLLVRLRGDEGARYAILSGRDGSVKASLRAGGPHHVLEAISSDSTAAIFSERNRSLQRIGGAGDALTTLVTINRGLDEVVEPERRVIDYVSSDGQSLKAVLLLPVGYVPGRAYPTVVSVYPGQSFEAASDVRASKYEFNALNPLLLSAHGYAVLFPSMPMRPRGEASNPLREIPAGVLPAVARAAELGYTNPEQVGVTGISYGGYATAALVTQTNMFKAAIIHAGQTNLVSTYGAFWHQNRGRDDAHLTLADPLRAETGQNRMGEPLYFDVERYVANSPVTHLASVTTPVLLIYGDLDFISIAQGEEMFTGLYRLGKEAEFVRYWGEWHGLESPANIRDSWQRMLSWFDRHLRNTSNDEVSSP